jgi:hypothetical protein
MNYWVFTFPPTKGVAVITAWPQGGPKDYLYNEAKPLAPAYPAGATMAFSQNFPDDRKLADFQPNTLAGVIVSAKARGVIEGLKVDNAEFLPVAIKDHKDRVVDDNYAVLNLLGAEDAIDMQRSQYSLGAIRKDQIMDLHKLVLQPDKIRPEAKIFRCSQQRRLILIRDDVRETFEQHGLTGYKLYAAEGWDGMDI